MADGRAQGFVSAGSTGAMLAASLLVVKRIRGVKRPAILTVLPGLAGPVVFLDAGANADCRPEHLLEFGVLGSIFARLSLGIASPRVGLLNIGEEATKGSELALQAHALLAASDLRFVGNVEGRDLLFDLADVVVTDGFTGNVGLKLLEGTARALLMRMKDAAGRDARSKVGGAAAAPGPAGHAGVARPRGVRRHLPAGRAGPGRDLPRQLVAAGHHQRAALRRRRGAAAGGRVGRGRAWVAMTNAALPAPMGSP